jgi:hypothetical protein
VLRRPFLCPASRVNSHHHCRVTIDDRSFMVRVWDYVGSTSPPTMSLMKASIVRFPRSETCDEFVVNDASKGGRVVFNFSHHPSVAEIDHSLVLRQQAAESWCSLVLWLKTKQSCSRRMLRIGPLVLAILVSQCPPNLLHECEWHVTSVDREGQSATCAASPSLSVDEKSRGC